MPCWVRVSPLAIAPGAILDGGGVVVVVVVEGIYRAVSLEKDLARGGDGYVGERVKTERREGPTV